MSSRLERYAAFDNFRKAAKDLFEGYEKSTPGCERLHNLYSFCVAPGGRFGGLDKRKIEVFYGNRPFDSKTEIGPEYKPRDKIETAHGATLAYERTDDGKVLCTLHPAASENFHPEEDFLLIELLKNPARLEHKSKLHWKMFLAYMEVTCLDGEPSALQRLRVWYLRNFKERVISNVLQARRSSRFAGEMFKYAASVGLSGFIIFFVAQAIESRKVAERSQRNQELSETISAIGSATNSIEESTKAMESRLGSFEQRIAEDLHAFGRTISASNGRLEEAISQLRDIRDSQVKANENEEIKE